MTTASTSEAKEQFEIRIGRDCYDHADQEGARMRVLGEREFIELLQDRLGKTVSEIHSYVTRSCRRFGRNLFNCS